MATNASFPAPSPNLLSAKREAGAFGRIRRRLLAAMVRQMLTKARFRASLIVVLTSLLWAGIFWMFLDGFVFLKTTITHEDTYERIVAAMFGAFFAALIVILIFSAAIILYGSLFRSREMTYLMTVPARTGRLFLHKFYEDVILCSWGFILLGSPMLLAYGVVAESPWYYYVLLLPFLIAFVYIPVAIGAILCLGIVRWFPDHRLTVLVAAGAVVLAAVAWMARGVVRAPASDLLTPSWFQEILGRLQVCNHRLLPGWWLTTGLVDAAKGAANESVLFLTLMISNALFFRQLALWIADRIYRPAYNGLYGKTLRRKRSRFVWFDNWLSRLLCWLPATMRLMTIKDFRLFRRDPLQWSQVLIFGGLIVGYYFFIPTFTYEVSVKVWVNMVSFLNLAVVGLLLSTFTTRFIYPMISLEGRRFWILGLLGMRRESVLWGKFLFALSAVPPCAVLVFLSDNVLHVVRTDPMVAILHQITCLMFCFGLAGIAVGFGAWFPNPREDSPSRLAAGFGGTMTLVVSTLFILILVLMTALPTHLCLTVTHGNTDVAHAPLAWWGGVVGTVVFGAAATLFPLWIGFRAFRRLEF